MENTTALIGILKERESLARELKEFKEAAGIPLRDRQQELNVLRKSGLDTPRDRSILNMIFEYTINVQERPRNQPLCVTGKEKEPVTVKGDEDYIHYIAGLLISSPGREIRSTGELNNHMRDGILENGGHFIPGELKDPDIRVCIGFDGPECSISITDGNNMKIRTDALAPGNIEKTALIEVDK